MVGYVSNMNRMKIMIACSDSDVKESRLSKKKIQKRAAAAHPVRTDPRNRLNGLQVC